MLDILYYIDQEERNNQSNTTRGSILIFLPGIAEINEVRNHIRRYSDDRDQRLNKSKYLLYRLHSSLPRTKDELHKLMNPPIPGYRY